MATVSFWADDLAAAKNWYSELLGIEPYFVIPGYIEFRIGDSEDELGIIDRNFATLPTKRSGAILFWHVDNLEETLDKLLDMGAELLEGITDRTEGFKTASVIDPFGNILGIMYNPHYLEKLV